MTEKQEGLTAQMDTWIQSEDAEKREDIWKEMIQDPAFESFLLDYVRGITEAAVQKQALAEERQNLLNKWQREKEEALQAAETMKGQLEAARTQKAKAEWRLREYEKQLIRMQKAATTFNFDLEAFESNLDRIVGQIEGQDADSIGYRHQIDKLNAQLTEAKQYGAEMAMKVGEMEKLFPVRVYRKLHGG